MVTWQKIYNKYKFAAKVVEKRNLPQMWNKYERYYGNDYWYNNNRPEHLTRATSNDLMEYVEVTLPVITARPPQPDIHVEPSIDVIRTFQQAISEAQDEEKAQIEEEQRQYYADLNDWATHLQKELVKVFVETKMKDKLERLYREFSVKGTAVINSEYDPRAKNKIRNVPVDITTVFPDPSKESLEECIDSWFIIAEYKLVSEIKREYDVDVPAEGDFEPDGSFKMYPMLSRLRTATKNALSTEAGNDGYALVIKMYMADDSQMEYEVNVETETGEYKKDEQGNNITEKKTKPAYPHGRVVTIIRNLKDKIVRDEPNPYEVWPYFSLINYARIKDPWGTSDGKNIEGHTLTKINIMSDIIDNAHFTGNPASATSPEFEEELTVEPGRNYEESVPGSVRFINPPSMPGYIAQFLEYNDKDRDKKSGVNDSLRAESNPGDSGVKTRTLLSQATGRLNPRVNAVITLCRELYMHWAYIIRNYYDEPVVHKEEDENGNASFTVFDPKQFDDVNISISINVLSMLPYDVFQEFEEAQVLFGAGAMSPEQLVDSAPTLRDKQRAKDWVAKKQERDDHQLQENNAIEQFTQIAKQIIKTQDTPDQDQVFQQAVGIAKQFPVVMSTQPFKELPDKIKQAIGLSVAMEQI